MSESSLTLGFDRTRSPSTTVTATVSTFTVVAVGDRVGAAVGPAVGEAVGLVVGVATGAGVGAGGVAVAGGAVGGGGAEVDDMLQPAMRTMTVSRTATEREFVPVIAPVASRDAQR